MKINNNLKYLVALANFSRFGPVSLRKLEKKFTNLEEVFQVSINVLEEAGIESSIAQEFIKERAKIFPDEIMENLEKENIKIISYNEESYPVLLKEIYDAPRLLFYRGELQKNNDTCSLAIVGTRKMSIYGRRVTEDIVKSLTQNGLVIVSGLALGIDTIAHETTLFNNGRTIAILGTGIDSIYPKENKNLADKIIDSGGAIISEFPLKTPPLKFNFPQRNRIIAGMTLGTVVIEADIKSGALITSKYALDYNREIFAVPGGIYAFSSKGTNNLIKEGARVVLSADDILESLNIQRTQTYLENKQNILNSPEENLILSLLEKEVKHLNELVRESGLDTSQINATLIIMEMKGMIKNLGNATYSK